jgi:beta-lactamase superfamily II metal-dependent hydrolase
MQEGFSGFSGDWPTKLIARLCRVEAIVNDGLANVNANRVSFEFDTIDAEVPPENALAMIDGNADPSRLFLLKILTTSSEFSRLAQMFEEAADGQWFSINLLPRGKISGPLAWASSLSPGGYLQTIPMVVENIRFLFSDVDRPLRPVGAAVDADVSLAGAIVKACEFPATAIGKVSAAKAVLASLPAPTTITVHDVGQASLVTARDHRGKPLFHLDAGWPISYNLKTAAAKPTFGTIGLPVILSHWDWDHLHGYHAISGLSTGVWIAPIQRLGPGGAKVAKWLASQGRLFGIASSNLSAGAVVLGRSKGPKGDMNRTGLCARITLASGKALLFVGDADYDLARPTPVAPPDFLVAAHHGARFNGAVVVPATHGSICVVSVGKGNRYGHPSQKHIKKHTRSGWLVRYTCKHGAGSRGSRTLGP